MSEINNLSDIKENFDTIKSLLNSIRAQDVLNTGDMTKLLATINGKLDKLDQEEHLELMNSVLATIKQTLDERHSVLVSKFSTIESLFSNILKNSVDSLKSSEIKELFDIIATNLSVFSREVVSQKDTLTDIILRIEALRGEDPSSITIISNIDALKRDLERFNNGFESIIVNLNDNFGSIVKTLSDIKENSFDNHYDKDFENLYMTSNSLLLAVQSLDKKSVQLEETLANILAKTDSTKTSDKLTELALQNKEIYNSIGELAINCNVEPLYKKIDNATALIGSLKDILQNVDADSTSEYISKLSKMETAINRILDENDFRKVRTDLESALNQIANSVSLSQNDLYIVKNELETVASSIKALDIHVNFQNIQSTLTKSEVNIKTYINDLSNKFSQLSDLTFQKTVEDIKQKVDILGTEIKTVSRENVEALAGSLIGLKAGIDELEAIYGKAGESLFKNISERLASFENTLSGLLNAQNATLSNSGAQVTELSTSLNIKMDTATAELMTAQKGIDSLKVKLDNLINADYSSLIAEIKDGIADSKTEVLNTLNQSDSELLKSVSEKFNEASLQTDECSRNLTAIYKDGLSELRSLLNSITSTLIDIVSYVSVNDTNKTNSLEFEKKLSDIEYSVKDYSLDSIEKINAFIKENIEKINTRLTNYDATSQNNFQNLATKIENNSTYIRDDIKTTYKTLEAVKADIEEFKEYVIADINNNPIRTEIVDRMAGLRNFLTESLGSFEAKFLQQNQERLLELQDLNTRIAAKIDEIPEVSRKVLGGVSAEIINGINNSFNENIETALSEIRSYVEVSANTKDAEIANFKTNCERILEKFDSGISQSVERSILAQSEISEKLENFGNTLYRLVGNGGISVNEAFQKIDEIGQSINDTNEQNLNAIINKMEALGIELSGILVNETSGKTAQRLEEILEQSEKSSSELFNGLQQLSTTHTKDSLEIKDDLEFIKSELLNSTTKQGSNAAVLDSIFEVKAVLDTQLQNLENLKNICSDTKDEEIVQAIDSLKAELSSKLAIETELVGLHKTLQELKNNATSPEEINAALTSLSNLINSVQSELPQGAIEYVRGQVELISETLGINGELASSLNDIKAQLTLIDDERKQLKKDIEEDFNKVLTAIEGISTTEEFKNYINTSLADLYNNIGARIDLSNSNTELTALITTVLAKQDANLAHIVARMDFINNEDVVGALGELKQEVVTQLLSVFNQISFEADAAEIKHSFEEAKEELTATLNKVSEDVKALFNQVEETLKTDKEDNLRAIAKIFASNERLAKTIEENQAVQLKAVADIAATTDALTKSVEESRNAQLAVISEIANANSELAKTVEANQIEQLNAFSNVLSSNEELSKALAENQATQTEAVNKLGELLKTNEELTETVENNHIFQLKAISEVTVSNKELIDSVELLKTQLTEIQHSEGEDANYSLTDIEADLTQLRLLLSDVKTNLNKPEFNQVFSSLDMVINQIQDLKDFIPVDKVDDINDNTIEVLDLLEGLAGELRNLHTTHDDIIGYVRDVESSVNSESDKIQMSLDDFANELKEFNKDTLSNKLATTKNDIITQILAIVNQISFIEEQEEIISHIDEVQSHIDEVQTHIDDVQAQINTLSTGSPNEMGDYSLLDIETDVAKLRVTLEEIKAQGRGEEIDGLVEALTEASATLNYLKTEIPNHEISEVRAELEKIANDIISISIRTNKLLISSDESYKDLKEHIETFQAVMDGVDERTKNLYEEVGMDKIEYQVTSIKDIVGRQELTNQVFNEVFEYLAEWVDSTGEKIGYITDKLSNTEDINEIKTSLEELRSSTSVKFELDAQSEKIDAMESKLNVIIESLEPTFQNHQERMQALERKINRIVDFFEPAFTKQQERINKLESLLDKILDVVSSGNGYGDTIDKLDRISEIVTAKDDTQLVKKLTSFEKQITKLNKSVEKLTTYANEK